MAAIDGARKYGRDRRRHRRRVCSQKRNGAVRGDDRDVVRLGLGLAALGPRNVVAQNGVLRRRRDNEVFGLRRNGDDFEWRERVVGQRGWGCIGWWIIAPLEPRRGGTHDREIATRAEIGG